MEMVAPQGHTMLATRGPLVFSEDQRRMIRDSFANGASDSEFAVLMAVAEARALNPLLRQVHFVARWDSEKSRHVWTTQVSIDGLRAIAQRTGLYAGQDEPEFIENPDGTLKACKVKVYRRDWDRPAVGVAYFSEYVQTRWDKKTSKQVTSSFWSRMPHTMLAKCAESLAIRKAFPEDTGGLYTPEEMGQAENERAEPEEPARRTASRRVEVQPAAMTPESFAALGVEQPRRVLDAPAEPPASWSTDLAACSTLADVRAAWETWRKTFADDGRSAMGDVRSWCERRGIHLDAAGITAALGTLPLDALRCLDAGRGTEVAIVDAGRTCRAAGWPEHATRTVWSALARGYAAVTGASSAQVAGRALKAACEEPPPPDGNDGPSGPRSAANDGGTGDGTAGDAAPADGASASIVDQIATAWSMSAPGITEHVGAITSARHLESSGRAHLRAISPGLRTHAIHAYADALIAMSRREEHDDEGHRVVSEMPRDTAVAQVERWLREGPRVQVARTAKKEAA